MQWLVLAHLMSGGSKGEAVLLVTARTASIYILGQSAGCEMDGADQNKSVKLPANYRIETLLKTLHRKGLF